MYKKIILLSLVLLVVGIAFSAQEPTMLDEKLLFLRSRLIIEEATEFLIAANNNNLVEMVDALCDILYVVYGTALSIGIDLEPIFQEVHRSNMTKSKERTFSGKIVKTNTDFSPPNIKGQIEQQNAKDKI